MRAFPEVLDLDSTILGRKHETLHLLDGTNAVDRVSVVGIYSGDRMGEYRKPGYGACDLASIDDLQNKGEAAARASRFYSRSDARSGIPADGSGRSGCRGDATTLSSTSTIGHDSGE
jgi:hypothetical protein